MSEQRRNLRNTISNKADMIVGCKNRMCITDDEKELVNLFRGAVAHASDLFTLNLERIRNEKK